MNAEPFLIDTATRGILRRFRQRLAEREACLERAVHSSGFTADTTDFVFKGTTGRERALKRLRQRLEPCGAVFQGSGRTGPYPWVLFLTFEAGGPAAKETPTSRRLAPGEHQDCVVACYLAIYRDAVDSRVIASGLWSIIIPDHALGRAIQRSRCNDPLPYLLAAHTAALNLPLALTAVSELAENPPTQLRIAAGPGHFIGRLQFMRSEGGRGVNGHLRCETWLADEQVSDRKLAALGAARGAAEAKADARYGHLVLLPTPLRELMQKTVPELKGKCDA
jgi:hypothetical protein